MKEQSEIVYLLNFFNWKWNWRKTFVWSSDSFFVLFDIVNNDGVTDISIMMSPAHKMILQKVIEEVVHASEIVTSI